MSEEQANYEVDISKTLEDIEKEEASVEEPIVDPNEVKAVEIDEEQETDSSDITDEEVEAMQNAYSAMDELLSESPLLIPASDMVAISNENKRSNRILEGMMRTIISVAKRGGRRALCEIKVSQFEMDEISNKLVELGYEIQKIEFHNEVRHVTVVW